MHLLLVVATKKCPQCGLPTAAQIAVRPAREDSFTNRVIVVVDLCGRAVGDSPLGNSLDVEPYRRQPVHPVAVVGDPQHLTTLGQQQLGSPLSFALVEVGELHLHCEFAPIRCGRRYIGYR